MIPKIVDEKVDQIIRRKKISFSNRKTLIPSGYTSLAKYLKLLVDE
jgi:hypothetical protein